MRRRWPRGVTGAPPRPRPLTGPPRPCRGLRLPASALLGLGELGTWRSRRRAAMCGSRYYPAPALGPGTAVAGALFRGQPRVPPLPARRAGTCLRARAAPALRASGGRGVPVGVRRRLRAGLCGRAVGLAAGAGRGGPGDAGPGAAAPPRSCRSRRPKFRRICSARSSTTRWATSTRRYRPHGAPPSCLPLFRRAHALQDSEPEPRGTPGREGPRKEPREHRLGAAAGRASCGALPRASLVEGPVLSAPGFP